MPDYVDDTEIERLISVPKPLPDTWEARLRTRPRPEVSQKRANLEIQTTAGLFTVMIRESTINALDFSVILAFTRPNGDLFRLRRYNGLHGGHVNHIERQSIKGYHVHMATERYQIAGRSEDAYAIVSQGFVDIASALRLMFTECAFQQPPTKAPDEPPQLLLIPRK
jgi:hypothetical protein